MDETLPSFYVALTTQSPAGHDIAEDEWRVRSFTLRESLHEPFALTVVMVLDEHHLALRALLGAKLSFTIERGELLRVVRGVVQRARYIGTAQVGGSLLELEVVPTFALHDLEKRSRIYSAQSVTEILSWVQQHCAWGPQTQVLSQCEDEPEVRDYCVQYEESTLAFLLRILAEEGITVAFDTTNSGELDAEQLVLLTRNTDFVTIGEQWGAGYGRIAEVPLLRGSAETTGFNEGIRRIDWRESVRPAGTRARAWDWKQSEYVDLESVSMAEDQAPITAAEVVLHDLARLCEGSDGGGPARDTTLAQATYRAQQQHVAEHQVAGESTVLGFFAGVTFALREHLEDDLNGAYYVTDVVHHGDFPEAVPAEGGAPTGETRYINRFVARAISADFRPAIPSKPRVGGDQLAVVVGGKCDEIFTDKYGRIKVRFHWDNSGRADPQATCWLRVKQAWAGNGFGAMFLPRVGMEVVVSFLNGDPDRPIVDGCVYNERNQPPYSLPEHKTRSVLKTESSPSGGGFNELRFEDACGSEEVFMHAQRDFNVVVLRNDSMCVGADQHVDIGRDRVEYIKRDATFQVDGSRAKTITGSETATVGGQRATYVDDKESHHVHGALSQCYDSGRTTVVTGNDALKVGQGNHGIDVTSGAYSVAAASKIQLVQDRNHSLSLEGGACLNTTGDFSVCNEHCSLHSHGMSVTLEANSSLLLKRGGSSIEMSRSGDIVIAAEKSIVLKVGEVSAFKLDATSIAAQSSKIGVNSCGPLELKGALVKIN